MITFDIDYWKPVLHALQQWTTTIDKTNFPFFTRKTQYEEIHNN